MAIILGAPLLAGCAINKDLRLDTQGPGLPANTAVSIETVPAGTENASRFAAALADAFAGSGHAVNEDAPVTAVFGFSLRDRSTGTAQVSDAGEARPPEVKWISAPARKRAFQACEGERLRATLALYSRNDKTLIYRGTGEIDGCDITQGEIDALAKALVKGAGG
ncbi:MAG: hypothetical protein EDM03_13260 [Porphyrobacter sp. IPPAS B-1204]|nr:MAG: hypothetical protein EDM03_13260 [Porphyrobacter sp. IPPAS B-1204]